MYATSATPCHQSVLLQLQDLPVDLGHPLIAGAVLRDHHDLDSVALRRSIRTISSCWQASTSSAHCSTAATCPPLSSLHPRCSRFESTTRRKRLVQLPLHLNRFIYATLASTCGSTASVALARKLPQGNYTTHRVDVPLAGGHEGVFHQVQRLLFRQLGDPVRLRQHLRMYQAYLNRRV
jgi:hypothetical protein